MSQPCSNPHWRKSASCAGSIVVSPVSFDTSVANSRCSTRCWISGLASPGISERRATLLRGAPVSGSMPTKVPKDKEARLALLRRGLIPWLASPYFGVRRRGEKGLSAYCLLAGRANSPRTPENSKPRTSSTWFLAQSGRQGACIRTQLSKERLCIFQVDGVEALSKTAVNYGE